MIQIQVFGVIIVQADDTTFDVKYTLDDKTGLVAKVKIVKKTDANYFIEVYVLNNYISWNGHYPTPSRISQDKGLTVMVFT